ncbi:hypothetical protein A8C56_14075 [Niabella ginsenosidivorans]|uniref:DUF2071 domain-containing protein n=1 Tax=Niabella ginsenosidivorans TaxID=1176587 RepID=A0A1A9I3Q3_9BACT|nr:DUF2071 domain-containing protein [Niabella ginsenosidivorans]ANH81945.1 hypothetical protein A8C56_14075 [Niabella ginsenosidivorans]
MLPFLKNHPFPVTAFFVRSMVLTFALPREQLAPLIPECLLLDEYADRWAFLAVAIVQTKNLRPSGFPAFLGHDFFLLGYRIFVKYINNKGNRLRGLYILKSETNKKRMELLGNLFTQYSYTTTDIDYRAGNQHFSVVSRQSGFLLQAGLTDGETSLPAGSPFPDWKTARRYAGPLPFTFSYNKEKREVLIIKGVRQYWTPQPLQIDNYQIPFLEQPAFKNALLANAFIIQNIPYRWEKGKKEIWAP